MNNIERAIERLSAVTKTQCGPEFSHSYTVNLNDYRAEIVALMRACCFYISTDGKEECGACSFSFPEHEKDCPLAALAAEILEGEKL